MSRRIGSATIVLMGCIAWCLPLSQTVAGAKGPDRTTSKTAVRPGKLSWHTDYARAMKLAEQQGRMLLILFYGADTHKIRDAFELKTLADATVCRKLRPYVRVRLPVDTEIVVDGKKVRLLEHGAFREMLGHQGMAILDFRNKKDEHYGDVVSAFPLTAKHSYPPERMSAILDLPAGTLTQRTLIYAVRIHPERPASTNGDTNSVLVEEARLHSHHQARIRLQGHHQWGTRFHRIRARLPGGLTASEVCAESWPGENLLEAAIECVRCWRLSSGHWSAVRAHHRYYGYDMKRGINGVWYATGIFGRR